MKFNSTTFAVSLELCIVLFCMFSIVYLWKLRKGQNRWLLFAYFALGFPFLNLLFGVERYGILPYTPFLQNPSPILLLFPAIYLYTLKLVKPDTLQGGRAYLHFIPFLLFYWIFVVLGFDKPEDLFFNERPPLHIAAFLLFNALYAIVYLFLTLKIVLQTQKHYQEEFANKSPFITLSWIKVMLYIIVFIAALRFLSLVFPLIEGSIRRNITLLSIMLVISILSYFSFRQPILYCEKAKSPPPQKSLSAAPINVDLEEAPGKTISEKEKAALIQRLENFMLSEKPFLNPTIRMPDLAASLNIPRHVFSNLINEHYGLNFFHFINQYRVEHAKKLLLDAAYENYTLETIGEFSGFNSRSTFNRIFKKLTGKSPREFQRDNI